MCMLKYTFFNLSLTTSLIILNSVLPRFLNCSVHAYLLVFTCIYIYTHTQTHKQLNEDSMKIAIECYKYPNIL